MLKRRNTLPASGFPLRKGARASLGWAFLIVRRAESADEPTRFGIVTPARTVGNSVMRNRAQRQIRVLLHNTLLRDFPAGWLVVVHVIDMAKFPSAEQRERAITGAMRRAVSKQ